MTLTGGTTTTLWNKSHSTISESINQALVYLKSSKVSQDAIWSVVVGVVLGLAILLLLTAFPGKNSAERMDHAYLFQIIEKNVVLRAVFSKQTRGHLT